MKKICKLSFLLFVLTLLLSQLTVANSGLQTVQANQPLEDCVPGSGWKWVEGPNQPAVAVQAQAALLKIGISAAVTAKGYGEEDSCGSYEPYGVDFFVALPENKFALETAQGEFYSQLRLTLDSLDGIRVGNVQVKDASGEVRALPGKAAPEFLNQLKGIETWSSQRSGNTYLYPIHTKKVYVVVYDPFVDAGKTERLSEHFYWNNHTDITYNTINLFYQSSGGRMIFNVVDTVILDEFPTKNSGYTFTVADYLKVINGYPNPQANEMVNYNRIVNDSRLDICGKANRGEIDEVWIYNGPYFGFWESTLVGPDSYWYNSLPVPGPWTCTRTIPIMGPNPERWTAESVENFGHRTESTMEMVYGYGQQNQTRNNWEKFSLVKAQSPNYNFSGCGSIHYPPNGVQDYDYDNPSVVQTDCEDFNNYPNITYPPNASVLKQVTCAEWGCDHAAYFAWWYSHFPASPGCGTDFVANDWWVYFANPSIAWSPMNGCSLTHVFLPEVLMP